MIGYMTVGTNDLEKAGQFYDELFTIIGAKRFMADDHIIIWAIKPGAGMFSVIKPNDGKKATVGNGTMVAFAVDSFEKVKNLHAKALALGADWANSARGFMFSIGCIQAQACHTNHCPTGVATQDKARQKALVVPDKAERVAHFHKNTLKALGDMTGAAGLTHPSQFLPHHLLMRENDRDMVTGKDVYPYMPEGFLLRGDDTRFGYLERWNRARAEGFEPVDDGV